MSSRQIPAEKINLRLILVSGKSKEFLFAPSDSAADIAQYVYENWPEEWSEEHIAPNSTVNILRLIYQGRFLHGNVTLGALQLPLGKTTVMHLVARENLPEPNKEGQLKKDKSGESTCSNCCNILWLGVVGRRRWPSFTSPWTYASAVQCTLKTLTSLFTLPFLDCVHTMDRVKSITASLGPWNIFVCIHGWSWTYIPARFQQ